MAISLPSSLQINENTIISILAMLLEAGKIALKYHSSNELSIKYKEDASPVTNADIEVNNLIMKKLQDITPKISIISEENEYNNFTGNAFWLVDPIDGTKNYINGSSTYTINLALVHKHLPVLGFIYHPSLDEMHYTNLDGEVICYNTKEQKKSVSLPQEDSDKVRVLIDRQQLNLAKIDDKDAFVKVYPSTTRCKISMLFNNEADVYYLYRSIMEWDTAAGHAILRSLGGDIIDMEGNLLVYGKPFFCNSNIIICNKNALRDKQLVLNSY
jgi:3'(2'), 5'-bisphosphate nucleotidase